MTQSARCPWCHDLFVPEMQAAIGQLEIPCIPEHFLDTQEGAPSCPGSGVATMGTCK